MPLPQLLRDLAQRSAAPAAVAAWLEQLESDSSPAATLLRELSGAEHGFGELAVTIAAASRSLARLLLTDEKAPAVLADLDAAGSPAEVADPRQLARWKRLELLRIAARDLGGLDGLDGVGHQLAEMGDVVMQGAWRLSGSPGLAVIAMGKLGAEELNYSSDVDILFVGTGDRGDEVACRAILAIARQSVRVDAALRPEGRDGPLVRSLDSYHAYWDRWARPWERQALIKARACAGDRALGGAFEAAAGERVWGGRLDADAISELRSMKARAELEVERRGLREREIKLGPGGIRDIEFAVQLLQLVHGPADPALRLRATVPALAELASAGYVGTDDGVALTLAYRFLRTVEHRLQLVEEAQVHTVPTGAAQRDHLARVLGLSAHAGVAPADRFAELLARHQATVRSIHERLYFRPLLGAFTATGGPLDAPAVEHRLAAFGFKDAERTRQAFGELTRGLTRSSRLMQQLMPLVLDWCSSSPDPDLALLGLRSLASGTHARDVLVASFRESPEAARRLCLVAGTSREVVELLRREPELISRLGDDAALAERGEAALEALASLQAASAAERAPGALRRLAGSELARIAVRDMLGLDDVPATGRSLSALGRSVVSAALAAVSPKVPLAVVAMGRFGGAEQAYGSDLDVLLVYDGAGASDAAAAEEAAAALLRLLNGATPAERVMATDVALRPEGRHGALARSLDAFRAYYGQRAQTWERQALLRARPVAGSDEVAARFSELVSSVLWDRPLDEETVREIRRMKARIERERLPPASDPQFHLKLGRGSLSDIEWTAQLLQMRHGVPSTSTIGALEALESAGHLRRHDAAVLRDSYRYCERARNRWHLVGGHLATREPAGRSGAADALPSRPEQLSRLARSLDTTPAALRDEYRRVTRRARQVVERLFYGL
jgi:glutamate-ammonia-ligase adenylyltransferase